MLTKNLILLSYFIDFVSFRYIFFSYFTDFVVSFRWISFSYFTDFVSFRWISFSYFTDFVGFCFRFVSFRFSVYRYPLYSPWFDPTGDRSHDVPHSRARTLTTTPIRLPKGTEIYSG